MQTGWNSLMIVWSPPSATAMHAGGRQISVFSSYRRKSGKTKADLMDCGCGTTICRKPKRGQNSIPARWKKRKRNFSVFLANSKIVSAEIKRRKSRRKGWRKLSGQKSRDGRKHCWQKAKSAKD